MATGDFNNNVRKLQLELKRLKYSSELQIAGIKAGISEAYVPILKYAFMEFSKNLMTDIENMGLDPSSAEDDTLRFIEVCYRILRDLFEFKPALNKDQFYSAGFAERKVMVCTEVLQLVHKRYGRRPATKSKTVAAVATAAVSGNTTEGHDFSVFKVHLGVPVTTTDNGTQEKEAVGAVGGNVDVFNEESPEIYDAYTLGPRTSSPLVVSMPNGTEKRPEEAIRPLNRTIMDSKPFRSTGDEINIKVTLARMQKDIHTIKKHCERLKEEFHIVSEMTEEVRDTLKSINWKLNPTD